jgi:hypothetical protein
MDVGVATKHLPDFEDARVFLDGSRRAAVTLRSAVIGYGVYQPGWTWSRDAGPQTGRPSAHHVGFIIAGHMTVRDAAGREWLLRPGDAFEVGPGHDAWVVGSGGQ